MGEPISPSSDHCVSRSRRSRSRLMTEPQEQSPARHSKSTVAKPSLCRRVTEPSRTGQNLHSSSASFDVPFEISFRVCHSDRDEVDDVSDISLNEGDEKDAFGWGKSFPVGDISLLTDSTHIVESSGSSVPPGQANVPMQLEYQETWPSDEGSPVKRQPSEERIDDDLPPMMLQLCSLDDERQDYSIPPLDSKDLLFVQGLDDDRHEQPNVI